MAKLSNVSLRLLGTFAIEANVGRPIAIAVRSKKARAVLAYLAMKQNCQARREELATLLWGDNPDEVARHSLRQCLISLRRDLCAASEILIADREFVALNPHLLVIDAHRFLSLSGSSRRDELVQAAELWRGGFVPGLILDIEEFDAWHRREAERLAAAAAGVFETLCRNADADGEGDRAMATAERLIELDPSREDWQRTALLICARYGGREAALARAKAFTEWLREELGAAPEAATRALIGKIERGDFEAARTRDRPLADSPSAVRSPAPAAKRPEADALVPSADASDAPSSCEPVCAPDRPAADLPSGIAAPPGWQIRFRMKPLAAWASAAFFLLVGVGVMGLAGSRFWPWRGYSQPNQAVAVLPFAVDNPRRPDDSAFARLLTHDLIGYLSRFAALRVISETASDAYGSGQAAPDLMADLGVRYAVVGHVQGDESRLKIDFQLVDATTRSNVWSDSLQRKRDDATLVADEAARGIARTTAVEIYRRAAIVMRAKPRSQLTLGQLVGRGYLALGRGTTPENLSDAMSALDEALHRNPHYLPALLAVAHVQIVAAMNFIDLKPAPDIQSAEQVVNQTLARFPNSIIALYNLALLQKYRHQYDASIRTLQRCLEINPSFLPAQGQIGDLLVRTGQAQRGLQQILETMRAATPNDPTTGYWYLFAAEAELELGDARAALDWALRADVLMPGSPLVQARLAAIYAIAGDKSRAARYVAILSKIAPERTRLFLNRPVNVRSGLRIFQGLRLALSATPG